VINKSFQRTSDERACSEIVRAMSSKQVIALGTYHAAQRSGQELNAQFANVISLISETHSVEIILEECSGPLALQFGVTVGLIQR